MDDRLSRLAKAAAASLRGEATDAQYIHAEALEIHSNRDQYQTNALWHTLVDAANALNDCGEYALAGELFELLLLQARERRYPKLEFDSLEGLALSWVYLGDRQRASALLHDGLALAKRLNKQVAIDRFEDALNQFQNETPAFVNVPIKAPVENPNRRKTQKSFISTLLKKERNR